jgi:hypothetical protein
MTVELLAVLFRIPEAMNSNRGSPTVMVDVFVGFLRPFVSYRLYLKLDHDRLFPHPL